MWQNTPLFAIKFYSVGYRFLVPHFVVLVIGDSITYRAIRTLLDKGGNHAEKTGF